MPQPSTEQFSDRFELGIMLDHLWSETMGLPVDDKERVLAKLIDVLGREGVSYAVMGGVAVQLYTEEPRTTADLDIALHDRDDIPRESLERAGFMHDGSHEWSENWRSPAPAGTHRRARIAVQFSADRLMSSSVDRAVIVRAGDLSFPLVTMEDLILLKLAAAEEPKRRASKRNQDVTDVTRLMEEHPELGSGEIRRRVRTVKLRLLDR
jgi:Nucleotidyl transferase of unknown function (DUF2204)